MRPLLVEDQNRGHQISNDKQIKLSFAKIE